MRVFVCTALFCAGLLWPFSSAASETFTGDVLYSAEVWTAASGGLSADARYLDNLDIILDTDLEKGIGWRGATLFLYGLYNNGQSISALTGDAQFISNLESGVEAFRLYEAWIEQEFNGGSVKFGMIDLNADFDVVDAAAPFLHASHGIGATLGLSGRNGPSIFPVTSLGARIEYALSDRFKLRLAVLDGVPGDPERPALTTIALGSGDGALLTAELEAAIPSGKILLGHWRYTADFQRFDGTVGAGNAGYYVRAERQLTRSALGGGRGLAGFVRFGIGDAQTNVYSGYIGAGLLYTGPLKQRCDDQLGFALAAAFTAPDFRAQTPVPKAEVNLELTYRIHITQYLTLQPDIQYIFNPANAPNQSDVLAIGLRAQIGFGF